LAKQNLEFADQFFFVHDCFFCDCTIRLYAIVSIFSYNEIKLTALA
jgi:hypothetical protein